MASAGERTIWLSAIRDVLDNEYFVTGSREALDALESVCSKHRKSLRAMASRSGGDERTHPSSHTPYAVLTTPEKNECLRCLHLESKQAKHRLDCLCKKLDAECAKSNIAVDETLDSDIWSLALEGRSAMVENFPKDLFQRVFWEQQEKAALRKDSCSMKWHPLFIKWCLYLWHISGKAYETMQKSKCIHLPLQCTLRDYTHYTTTRISFSSEVDKQIYGAVDFTKECNR